jgi:hypothetical protein
VAFAANRPAGTVNFLRLGTLRRTTSGWRRRPADRDVADPRQALADCLLRRCLNADQAKFSISHETIRTIFKRSVVIT